MILMAERPTMSCLLPQISVSRETKHRGPEKELKRIYFVYKTAYPLTSKTIPQFPPKWAVGSTSMNTRKVRHPEEWSYE